MFTDKLNRIRRSFRLHALCASFVAFFVLQPLHAQAVLPPETQAPQTAFMSGTTSSLPLMQYGQSPGYAHTSFPTHAIDAWSTPPASWAADSTTGSPMPAVGTESFYVGNEPPITVLPSYSRISYGDGSIKERGEAKGIYGSLSYGVRLLEGSFDDTDIRFGSGFDLHQRDYTVKYTDFWAEGMGYSIGGHFIQSNDITTDEVSTLITGVQWYEKDRWNADLDFFVSTYEEFRPDVTVLQLSGRYGSYRTKSDDYTVRREVAVHYIHTSEDIIGQRDIFSGELRWSVESGSMGISLFGWAGQQVFPVRNGGFLVFNLGDERVGGYGGEVRASLTRNGALIARLNNEHVRDSFNDVLTNQLVASLLYSFTF